MRATLSQAFRVNERERRQKTLWHLCARLKLATPVTGIFPLGCQR